MKKKRCEEIIYAIYKELHNKLRKEHPNIGLLSGLGGITLFLSHYEDLYENKNLTAESLDVLMKSANNYVETLTFCEGLSGICFLLTYLHKRGKYSYIIDTDIDDCFKDFICNNSINHSYEFLYGLVGIGNYLLLDIPSHQIHISAIIDWLDKNKETINWRNRVLFRWQEKVNIKSPYNLSMSHGMSGIVMFLAKLEIKHYKDSRVRTLLDGAVNYILSQQIDVEVYGSYFPYSSTADGPIKQKSRLAWCYGDLGIAITLYNAGIALNNNAIIGKSIEILKYAAQFRRDRDENLVLDAGLCHGSAGIAMIFYRIWWNTHLNEFKSACDYWINETLQFSKYENGLAGYLSLAQNNEFYQNWSLLEGIAGIGLVLLSYCNNTAPDWDACMFIS